MSEADDVTRLTEGIQQLMLYIDDIARGCEAFGTEHFCEQFGCQTLADLRDRLAAILKAEGASGNADADAAREQ